MESATITKPKSPLGQLRSVLRVAQFIAPAVATVLIGWGTVQFSQGRNSTRLDTVEKNLEETLTRQEFNTWSNEQRDLLRTTNEKTDRLVTRDEFRLFTEQNRDQFRELKEDLRSLKSK